MDNIKFGFFMFNATYIPNIVQKKKFTGNAKLKNDIYIKSKMSLDIEIGGTKYLLKSGEYYIPGFYTFHDINILTDLTNNDDCEVYHECMCDKDYFGAFKTMISDSILVKSIHPKNENEYIVFRGGMGGTLTYEQICERNKIDENNINFSAICWLQCHDVYMNKNSGDDTYSQFIYHVNIKDVQKDHDVTQYLTNWDKDFVRHSMPPCIAINYSESNYEALKKVLKKKYDINLYKCEPDYIRTVKPYDKIVSQIAERNNHIKKYEDLGIFKFVTLNEVPFTMDLYNELKKQVGDS